MRQRAAALPGLWLEASADSLPETLAAFTTAAADRLTRRLLDFAESDLGPPPAAYLWIAYGSQGREELTPGSDQDNALVLDDVALDNGALAYFAELARRVCDGLADCGFIHCPGNMMASNPAWRMSCQAWCRRFTDWIRHSDPHSARLASNFFDARPVAGTRSLFAPVLATLQAEFPTHDSLLAQWVANTRQHGPSLGLFRQFALSNDPAHAGQIDLKRRGILPVVELARIHAFAADVIDSCTGTLARLEAAAGRGWLSAAGARQLAEGYRFVLSLRQREQQLSLMAGQPVSHHVRPEDLGAGEKRRLREIFEHITLQQQALQQHFPWHAG